MKRHSRKKRWSRGPEFLWKPVSTWKNKIDHYEVDDHLDKEVNIIKINTVQIQSNILST